MELRRHIEVAWRWKKIMLAGLVAGIALAVLASFSVSLKDGFGLKPRGVEEWTSHSTLFITQAGFPWGKVVLDEPQAATGNANGAQGQSNQGQNSNNPLYAQPSRFGDLAIVYSYLGQSEQVRALIKSKPTERQISVGAVINNNYTLPLLNVDTIGATPEGAQKLNVATVEALKDYIKEQQSRAGYPADQRVELQVLNSPSKAYLSKGRSKLGPALAFVLCVLMAFGLAYLFENLYPRGGKLDAIEPQGPESVEAGGLRLANSGR